MEKKRNDLAKIRTNLANSRTLLSYVRTSLAMFGVAAFLFKFYVNDIVQVISAVVSGLAVSTIILGWMQYKKAQKKIDY